MSRGIVVRAAGVAAFAAFLGVLIGVGAHGLDVDAWLGIALAFSAAAAIAAAWLLWPVQAAVRDVSRAMARIARRELGGSVAVPGGPAEELASGFNAMSRRIEGLFLDMAAERARRDAMLEASTDGVLALAADTSVRVANRAAARLLGTTTEDMLGRSLIESARDYELDALARRVLATGEPSTEVITFGPERVPLRAAALPIAGGGEWPVLLLLTDLTEVNRVDQVRRDFVSNVSHELRTPLASIRVLAETIEAGDVEPGQETVEFAERITRQVDRLAALVNELLELSRIESGAVELRPEAVDVAAVARQAAALLQPRADGANVTMEIPDSGPIVEADPDAVLHVLTNLLDNAIKFSPAGGTVRVEAREEGDSVIMSVADEGPGIPAAELPRLFERFYKGDSSRSGMGVGLGLAIVKHTVRSHGGAVEVQSLEGEGARFVVRLPRRFAGPRAPRDR